MRFSMKVSIITVSYNSRTTIRDTIQSVLQQTYPAIEHIIVDGGSNDGTLDILGEYAETLGHVISEPDRGIYDAMNKGINVATGDVIGTLNADDVYASKDSVARLVSRLQEFDADCVFANMYVVDRNDLSRVIRFYDSGKFTPARLRYGWMPAHPTFFVKRECYERYGGYSLKYEIAADYEMMVRLFLVAGISFVHLPSVEVLMRAGGVSSAGLRSRWVLNREIVRACRENGVPTSLPRVLMKVPSKLMDYIRPAHRA